MTNIFKYILFIKRIETFWSRDVIDIWVLAHFEFKSHEYIRDISPIKIRKEKNLNYVKMNLYSQRFLNYIK